MDWTILEGLLLSWSYYLDILWRRDPAFTQKHECFHVYYIYIYWHSKCFNDGMISGAMIFPSFTKTSHYTFFTWK